MKSKKIVIILIVIDFMIMTIICNFINKNIIKEKQIIKEMNESTQVEELNNQINALNTEHTEYMNYMQTCKTKIATALTNERVATSNEATLETMAENISKVLQARTSDATATADNITEGKTAYVNGELIIGTGVDNSNFYEQGAGIIQEIYIPSLSCYASTPYGSSVSVTLGELEKYTQLTIDSGSPNVQGSTNGSNWTTISRNNNVYDITNYKYIKFSQSFSGSWGSSGEYVGGTTNITGIRIK